MPFVTVEELELYMDETFDAQRTLRAAQLLGITQAAIQRRVDQKIERVVDDTIILDGSGSRLLQLPERPVTDVDSVELQGIGLTYLLDFTWNSAGQLEHLRTSWGTRPQSIEVTYTHGFDPIPLDLKGATMEIVKRALQAGAGAGEVIAETLAVGTYSESRRYSEGATTEGNVLDPASIIDSYKWMAVA